MKNNLIIILSLILSFSSCYYDDEETLYGNISCETSSVSFSKDIKPIIATNCAISGCHVQGGAGSGIFENYTQIKDKVDNGSLKNRVIVQKDMPPSKPLTNCQIQYIEQWINDGALNN